MADIGLIGGYRDGQVFDGTSTPNNCSTTDQILWTYSAGMLLNAAAVMWNKTQNPLWETRVMDIWAACIVSVMSHFVTRKDRAVEVYLLCRRSYVQVFFPNDTQTMVEVACEPYERCDTDELRYSPALEPIRRLASLHVLVTTDNPTASKPTLPASWQQARK